MTVFEKGMDIRANRTNEPSSVRGARYGRVLFVVYLLLYGGYVCITAFAPAIMQRTPLAGINLSVLYGLALIATAILMALVYDWICRLAAHSGGSASEGGRR